VERSPSEDKDTFIGGVEVTDERIGVKGILTVPEYKGSTPCSGANAAVVFPYNWKRIKRSLEFLEGGRPAFLWGFTDFSSVFCRAGLSCRVACFSSDVQGRWLEVPNRVSLKGDGGG